MPRTAWRFAAIASLLACAPAIAATRPRYGGTLHAQIHARLTSLDPREHDTASGKFAALVFETLVTLDDAAQVHPALAVSWRHDSDFRRWELQLRSGVRFQDGSPLTAPVAAAALAPLRVLVLGESLVFFSEQPAPKLLFTLANSAHSILKQAPDGSPVGTGPFRAEKWEPGKHAVFAANEDYWGGRPYLDSIELEMGRTAREQLLDFELGKADLVEIAFGDVRRASQNGRRLWTSASLDLLALVFESDDQRLREAIALSIDRPAISSVLLQNQGEPAGGLLPARISGYGFLFPPLPHDLDRARKLAAELPRNTPPPALAYDPAEPVAKAVADRMAVNAREAGILLRPIASAAGKGAAARLVRARISSLDPEQAFAALLSSLGVAAAPHPPTLEGLYAAERALIDGYSVVPLFRLPEVFGLGVRIRNWGAWKLDSVWLGPDKP